jgi:ligand-binding sensor domain-containing protein/signal transduction histidine kinase
VNYNTKNGLSSDLVTAILQDKYRMMWFATDNGLSQFNGSNFVSYQNEENDDKSLSDNRITSLTEDIFGNIWVGTKNGLNRYNRKSNDFTRFPVQHNEIQILYADKKGFLWIGTQNSLSKFDFKTGKITELNVNAHQLEGDYHYFSTFVDSKNNLWLAGRQKTPQFIDLFTSKIVEIQYDASVKYYETSCIVETNNGEILSGNYPNKSLDKYNPKTHQFEHFLNVSIAPCTALCDKNGKIWLAGDGGLLMIDIEKKVIETIRNQTFNPQSLLSNKVICMYEDKDNNIWLGTENGISFYGFSRNVIRHYRRFYGLEKTFSSNQIIALMQDFDGLLWVGTTENGVDTFSLKQEKAGNLKYNVIGQNVDNQTKNREYENLKKYTAHGFTSNEKKLNENKISSLYQDKDGKIYIGLWSHVGFNIFDKKTGIFKRYALWGSKNDNSYPRVFEGNLWGANWYSGFCEDNNGNLWIATWEGVGLNLFDRKTGQFSPKHFMPENRPKKDAVYQYYFDSLQQRIFIGGNYYFGFYDLKTNQFTRYAPKLPANYFNRELWQRYLNYCDVKLADLPFNTVIDSFAVVKNFIYIRCENEVVKYDMRSEEFSRIATQFNNLSIKRNVESDLLFVQKILTKAPNNALCSRLTNCITKDYTGNIWIGTTDNGISVFNPKTEKFQHYSFSDNYINHIFQSKDSTIWVASNNGLDRFISKSDNFMTINELNGNKIMNILEDKAGNLWVSSDNGLFCLSKNGKILRHIANFPNLQDLTFSKAACMLRNGDLAFGGNYGFNIFNPEELLKNITAKSIVFQNFTVNDMPRYFDVNDFSEIKLKHYENNIIIDFISTDYEFLEQISYRYKLENLDKDWIDVQFPNLTAKYTNLSHGKYVFVVEASDCFGEWENASQQKLVIIIATPWYFQIWFLTVILLILILLVIFIIKFRERNLKKSNLKLENTVAKRTFELQEAEKNLRQQIDAKNKFFSIISHDLRNPIKSLTQVCNMLYENFENLQDTDKQNLLKLVFETSEQTEILLDNLLLWTLSQREILKPNLQKINLFDCISETIASLHPTAQKKQIVIRNESFPELNIHADKNMFLTILRNLINNAIHYSYNHSEIIVFTEICKKSVKICVQDFGVGISEENQKLLFSIANKISTRGTNNEKGNGLGLILVSEFVKLQGGNVYVESIEGKGSLFVIELSI